MVHLYIGEGKGKTTAAIGQSIRMLGWNYKVLFAQFLKSWESGEMNILSSIKGLTVVRPNMRHKCFIWDMDEAALNETKDDLLEGFDLIRKSIYKQDYQLIVLDEILDCIECNIIPEKIIFDLINEAPSDIEFILTGRKASLQLKNIAHYITNMTKEKHPFDVGITARKGIEY